MCTSFQFRSLLLLSCLALFGAAPAFARPEPIQDNAGFFSPQAKSEAARKIAELERSAKKEVVVETFAELPADLRQGVNVSDKAALNRIFEQWAVKEARADGVNGIYMLLVKNPSHLHVIVGNDTQKQAFTQRDRDALVSLMLGKLRSRQFDDALLSGVDFVSSTMKSHLGGAARPAKSRAADAPAASQEKSSWLWPIVIGGIILWIVIAVFRSMSRSGGGAQGYGQQSPLGGGGGGGGFMQSMMGGLFGAAAGMWMYDHFLGGSSHAAPPSDNQNLERGDSGFSGHDTDYSGSGDSFSDSGGGGDFGGGGDGGGGGGDF